MSEETISTEPMRFTEAPNNFYLGARVDPETNEVIRDAPVYYDARDLTTHAVILGMTGSGKTGLGIVLLEEAAIDGIPQIIIDPKGDITNMLLAFPDLTAESFTPWVDPDEALRADQSPEEHAAAVAKRWQEGLTRWGIDNERVQTYRRAARFSIYTPGSHAGLPVSILQSFSAPAEGWEGNEEVLRERISAIVSALLGLIGIHAGPVEDPRHILLSNIFETNWQRGADLTMEQLILQVQRPPFGKLGVLDVDSVIDEKERIKLAQALNNIMAAPNFQTWIDGEPLDIPSLLFTPEGYPRTTIFYTAHLNEDERQFITTLLLGAIHSWMRAQSGSTSLRALLYIDEAFGMFPPHPYNPPTKEPLLALLKQARAFGVGVIVATQNPKDIDYKGLSNAGTWFIGKLQTDNDRERVLEGLDSARDATSALDVKTVDDLLGQLGPREFIIHNVHEPQTPILMTTRWAMSYLRGPLTRQQVSTLMANQRSLAEQHARQHHSRGPSHRPAAQGAMPAAAAASPAAAATSSVLPDAGVAVEAAETGITAREATPPGFSALPPSLSTAVEQYYLPAEYSIEYALQAWQEITHQHAEQVEPGERLLYRPALLTQTMVRFTHAPTKATQTRTYAFVVPNLPKVPFLEWAEYAADPFDPQALDTTPGGRAFYEDLPEQLDQAAGLKNLQANLIDWIYHNAAITLYQNDVLDMVSTPGEARNDFYARLTAVARERRDEEIDKVASRYDSRLAKIEDSVRKKAQRLDMERDELTARRREEMLTAGESLMQLMKGRTYYTLSRTSRMRRYTNSHEDRVGLMEQEMAEIAQQFEATEAEMEGALNEVQQKWSNAIRQVSEVRISPYKKDINPVLFGIGWVPYWYATIDGEARMLPATPSTLAYAQTPDL